jgi:tRNA threonylcarbamoyladenosine biosynthesis protein TsaE
MNKLRIESRSEADTRKVAEKLAGQLNGGELIELIGDVGAGKTAFVKGLAKGLGVKGQVSSPTFALKNIYKGNLEVHHLDLYRLQEPGLIEHEIAEAQEDPNSVTVIEWAGIAEDVLPEDRVIVKFEVGEKEMRFLEISL